MPKATDKQKIIVENNSILVTTPWSCTHFGDQSEIEAYSETTGKIEVLADVHAIDTFNAETIAEFIVGTVNNYENTQSALTDLIEALELCLKCEGLTWEAEHDGEIIMSRAKRWLK